MFIPETQMEKIVQMLVLLICIAAMLRVSTKAILHMHS